MIPDIDRGPPLRFRQQPSVGQSSNRAPGPGILRPDVSATSSRAGIRPAGDGSEIKGPPATFASPPSSGAVARPVRRWWAYSSTGPCLSCGPSVKKARGANTITLAHIGKSASDCSPQFRAIFNDFTPLRLRPEDRPDTLARSSKTGRQTGARCAREPSARREYRLPPDCPRPADGKDMRG